MNSYNFDLSFTKLIIWQIAHKLTKEIYLLSQTFPKDEQFGLISQIRRACVSIELCIAEGTARFYYKDINKFLFTVRGSIREVEVCLLIAADLGYTTSTKISPFNL